MGTRLIQQRRGKGSPTYKSPKHRFLGSICYPSVQDKLVKGEVIDIMNCRGHSAPLAYLEFDDGQACLIAAPLGLSVGDTIETGASTSLSTGSIVSLNNVPAGTEISGVELRPGMGPQFIRTSGSAAKVVENSKNGVVIQLPSRRKMKLNSRCRVVIGRIAGGGRTEKPFVKAGNKAHAMRAKNKLYPLVCGVAMNARDHPYGCTHRRGIGKSKSVSRHAPPGRKVGHVASRRSGRKKR